MTAQHARPMVAYLFVALAAALLLVAQGVTVPRDVPGVSGVIGGVSSLDLGTRVVLTPLQGLDEVAAVGGAVPQRVAEHRSVIRAAAPRAAAPRSVAPRAATRVRPRATGGQPGAVRSSGPRTHQPKPARASGAAPKANRPGKSRVASKGHARTSSSTGNTRPSLRSSPRETRGSQRGQASTKGHGRRARRP